MQAKAIGEEKKTEKVKIETKVNKLEFQRQKLAAKLSERDERIMEARRRAEEDRKDLAEVGHELGTLYGDPDELLRHTRVVSTDEIAENDFNLNIPRYVDTFDSEQRINVNDAVESLNQATLSLTHAEGELVNLLSIAGYKTVREC